jgi:hypothetical protein
MQEQYPAVYRGNNNDRHAYVCNLTFFGGLSMSQPIETLGLDEATAIILEYLREVATRPHAQRGMYGYDLWAPALANAWAAQACGSDTLRRDNIARRASPVFFEAAWELCRRGLIRPGIRESGGQAVSGGCGYSLTIRGRENLVAGDYDGFVAVQPGALATALEKFRDRFGEGFHQRCQEAIRCRDSEAWVAAITMIGAAAESMLLAVASAKSGKNDAALKAYASATGRKKLFNELAPASKPHLARPFSAIHGLLAYWGDASSHNSATTISRPEIEQAFRELLHLAQFFADNWEELSTGKATPKTETKAAEASSAEQPSKSETVSETSSKPSAAPTTALSSNTPQPSQTEQEFSRSSSDSPAQSDKLCATASTSAPTTATPSTPAREPSPTLPSSAVLVKPFVASLPVSVSKPPAIASFAPASADAKPETTATTSSGSTSMSASKAPSSVKLFGSPPALISKPSAIASFTPSSTDTSPSDTKSDLVVSSTTSAEQKEVQDNEAIDGDVKEREANIENTDKESLSASSANAEKNELEISTSETPASSPDSSADSDKQGATVTSSPEPSGAVVPTPFRPLTLLWNSMSGKSRSEAEAEKRNVSISAPALEESKRLTAEGVPVKPSNVTSIPLPASTPSGQTGAFSAETPETGEKPSETSEEYESEEPLAIKSKA